jgi:hypothetical protein
VPNLRLEIEVPIDSPGGDSTWRPINDFYHESRLS